MVECRPLTDQERLQSYGAVKDIFRSQFYYSPADVARMVDISLTDLWDLWHELRGPDYFMFGEVRLVSHGDFVKWKMAREKEKEERNKKRFYVSPDIPDARKFWRDYKLAKQAARRRIRDIRETLEWKRKRSIVRSRIRWGPAKIDELNEPRGYDLLAQAMLTALTPREERVLRLRFGLHSRKDFSRVEDSCYTFKEIGIEFGLSAFRINQIEKKGIAKLKKYFGVP